jgi:ABC-type sugar transport system substrate-binding protein
MPFYFYLQLIDSHPNISTADYFNNFNPEAVIFIAAGSFDNTILASVTNPTLTTIAQPMEEMGKLAVDLIVEHITGDKKAKQRTVFRPELLIRESTALYNTTLQ